MLKPRWLSTVLGLPLLFFTLDGLVAGDMKRPEAVGSIAGTKGIVMVDHRPVLEKEVVFNGELISTGAASGAYLNLHGTAAILVENSELALTRSATAASMTLKKGAMEIRSGASQPAEISLGKAFVVVRNDGDFPSICRIASVDKSSVVVADKGRVEIHGAGATLIVPPGKSVHLENGMPQAGGQSAGKVSAELPTATDQRDQKGNPNPLNLSDPVYMNDLVETHGNGRVRIALSDGSFLNIGARSKMVITRHDAQSQQTSIELKIGNIRAEVAKRTQGGKFETKTPTAVIGVVGTIFVADSPTTQDTGVWSINGDVTVSNVDPNVPGTVILHTGQFTHVPFGMPPASPTIAPSAQAQSEMQQTAIEEGGIAGATGGLSTGLTNGATLGATSVAAGVGGVSISALSKTHTSAASMAGSLADAANAAGQASSSASSAQSAASSAASASQQANNIVNDIANQVNGLLGGCGCVSPSGP